MSLNIATDDFLAGGPEEKRLRAFTSKKQRVIYDPRVVVPEAPDADRFFIAPDGDDQNPGTQEKPFATLQRARDAIRAARRNGAWKNGGTVFVRGGTYGVLATATFTEEDSGTAGAPIVYRAWQGEHPVFSGGVAVRDFLPETGDIRVARLPGVTPARQESYGWGVWRERVFEVYEDGEPLQVARWPNTGVARVGSVPRDDVITVQGPVGRWHAAKEMMLHGYWRYLWADATLPARAVGNELVFTERPVDGVLAGQPFYVMNLLEELDEPGEWFFDRENGRLHIWPRGKGDIVATHLPHPFIHGEKVRHIRFEGLTFEYGQENGLVFVSSENVWVAGCTVRRLGGSALKVMGDSRGVRVVGNRFHTLGHKGIFFEGGDRKTLRGSGSVIENNEVFDFARRSRTYQPALQLEGCGTRVSHNWFHDGPSSAMRIEGNDHDISFNLFERLVTESDDQGAIDMWGDPSYRGVVFRHNIFRDIGGGTPAPCGRNGIRFDDGICGMVVYGNIFERASQGNFGGVQIHGGDNNFVENNLFIDCAIGVSFSPWDWQRWQGFLAGDEIRQKLHGRVDIGGDVFQKKYPALARLGTPAEHNRNSICNNAFVRCGRTFFNAPDAAERVMNQSFDTLPDGFLENGFRSFAPIPVDRIGVRASPLVRFLR